MIDLADKEGWWEEQQQAFQDGWALRILQCPRHRCRRLEDCTLGVDSCPALKRHPFPEGQVEICRRMLRRAIEGRYRAIQAGPEAE